MKISKLLALFCTAFALFALIGCGNEYKDGPSSSNPTVNPTTSPTVDPTVPPTPDPTADTATKVMTTLSAGKLITDLCISTDGQYAYYVVGGADGKIVRQSLNDGTSEDFVTGLNDPFSVCYNSGVLYYTYNAYSTTAGVLAAVDVANNAEPVVLYSELHNPRYISASVNSVIIPEFGRGLGIFSLTENTFEHLLVHNYGQIKNQNCIDSSVYELTGEEYSNFLLSGNIGSSYPNNRIDSLNLMLDAFPHATEALTLRMDDTVFNVSVFPANAWGIADPEHTYITDYQSNMATYLAAWTDSFNSGSILCQDPISATPYKRVYYQVYCNSGSLKYLRDTDPMMSPIYDPNNSLIIYSSPCLNPETGKHFLDICVVSKASITDLKCLTSDAANKLDYKYTQRAAVEDDPAGPTYKWNNTETFGNQTVYATDPSSNSTGVFENETSRSLCNPQEVPFAFRIARSMADDATDRFYFTSHALSGQQSNSGIYALNGNTLEKLAGFTTEMRQDFPTVLLVNDKRTDLPDGYEELIWVCSGGEFNFTTGDFPNATTPPVIYRKVVKTTPEE